MYNYFLFIFWIRKIDGRFWLKFIYMYYDGGIVGNRFIWMILILKNIMFFIVNFEFCWNIFEYLFKLFIWLFVINCDVLENKFE